MHGYSDDKSVKIENYYDQYGKTDSTLSLSCKQSAMCLDEFIRFVIEFPEFVTAKIVEDYKLQIKFDLCQKSRVDILNGTRIFHVGGFHIKFTNIVVDRASPSIIIYTTLISEFLTCYNEMLNQAFDSDGTKAFFTILMKSKYMFEGMKENINTIINKLVSNISDNLLLPFLDAEKDDRTNIMLQNDIDVKHVVDTPFYQIRIPVSKLNRNVLSNTRFYLYEKSLSSDINFFMIMADYYRDEFTRMFNSNTRKFIYCTPDMLILNLTA